MVLVERENCYRSGWHRGTTSIQTVGPNIRESSNRDRGNAAVYEVLLEVTFLWVSFVLIKKNDETHGFLIFSKFSGST